MSRKSAETDQTSTQNQEMKNNKVIRVWSLDDSYRSAEINETDLEVWEKAGYSNKKPEVVLQASEKAILLKKTMGM